MHRSFLALLPLVAACAGPIGASAQDDERAAFIEANILGIFYHEMGHALIDTMQIPIFGQEEDAADVASVMMMNWFYEEEAAQEIAHFAAFGYLDDPDGEYETDYSSIHGPDQQRFFNHVCLFYGANPPEREAFAATLGLPEERAETCPDEYLQADLAWAGVFERMDALNTDATLSFVPGRGAAADFANTVLEGEVEAMNEDLVLPVAIEVRVESCDEANAFYDPEEVAVIFCTEYVDHLDWLYESYPGR